MFSIQCILYTVQYTLDSTLTVYQREIAEQKMRDDQAKSTATQQQPKTKSFNDGQSNQLQDQSLLKKETNLKVTYHAPDDDDCSR